MHITMLSYHACIRVQKIAIPLIDRGHTVNLITEKIPSFYELYNLVSVYGNKQHLKELIKLYNGITDIYHAHNEPSYFVSMVKEYSKNPVILDIHDTHITRTAKDQGVRNTVDEHNNFKLADGLVFVSDPVRNEVIKEYGLNKPSLTLEHYCPEMFNTYPREAYVGGLVYEGMIKLPEEIKSNPYFAYCDYLEFAKKAKKEGIDFWIYSRDDANFANYYKDMATLQNPLPAHELFRKLTRHDWGLVGNIFYSSQWEKTSPNKLFDYISACVPIVAINAKWCEDFILKYDIGIAVKSIKELKERWNEFNRCRENLIKRRQELVMENHIYKLEEFYGNIVREI